MALRVMQIYIPQEGNDDLEELLQGRDILGRWRDEDASQVVLHLLVPAEETEPIMDRFESQYGHTEGFHVILFPVEAVLPRPEPPPDTESSTEESDEKGEEEGEEEQEDSKEGHRVSREELYTDVTEGLGITRVFLGMTILSALVATVGLMRDDVAVIIGAMVIAPLLSPNVSMSLAATLGDYQLMGRALTTNLVGVAAAFVVAVAVGWVREIDPSIPAIEGRTQASWGDIALALAAGSAGTLAFTSGLAGPVIGVMMAVALIPPLVTCGMLLGQGHYYGAWGAFLLTVVNVVSINLAGVATFLIQGVRPHGWWEVKRAKKSSYGASLVWVVLLAILGVALWLSQ